MRAARCAIGYSPERAYAPQSADMNVKPLHDRIIVQRLKLDGMAVPDLKEDEVAVIDEKKS